MNSPASLGQQMQRGREPTHTRSIASIAEAVDAVGRKNTQEQLHMRLTWI
jgi:hypothetical protein